MKRAPVLNAWLTSFYCVAYWWGLRIVMAAVLRAVAVAVPSPAVPWLQWVFSTLLLVAGSALALRLFGLQRSLARSSPGKKWIPYALLGAALLFPVAKLSDLAVILLEQHGLCSDCSRHILRGTALDGTGMLQLLLIGVVVSALCEELMFREIVLLRVQKATTSTMAVVLSALSFAFCHQTIVAVLQAFLLGLCLGIVRIVTRTLATSVMVHAGFNLALAMVAVCFPMQVSAVVPERAADLPAIWVAASLGLAVFVAWPLFLRARVVRAASA